MPYPVACARGRTGAQAYPIAVVSALVTADGKVVVTYSKEVDVGAAGSFNPVTVTGAVGPDTSMRIKGFPTPNQVTYECRNGGIPAGAIVTVNAGGAVIDLDHFYSIGGPIPASNFSALTQPFPVSAQVNADYMDVTYDQIVTDATSGVGNNIQVTADSYGGTFNGVYQSGNGTSIITYFLPAGPVVSTDTVTISGDLGIVVVLDDSGVSTGTPWPDTGLPNTAFSNFAVTNNTPP